MKKVITVSILVSIFILLGLGDNLKAEVEHITLRVDGLACPFCAYGLEKKITRLEGVSSYDVGLKEGKVFVGLKSGAHIEIGSLYKAVKEAGFTLKGIKLTVSGRLSKWKDPVLGKDNLILKVSGSGQIFLLMEGGRMDGEGPNLDKLSTISDDTENMVIISGEVYEHKTKKLADRLPVGIIVESFKVK